MIMNAGKSPAGRAYAIRNTDALFTSGRYSDIEVARRDVEQIKAQAREMSREVGVYTVGEIVCRHTKSEAHEYFRYWTEEAVDWAAIDYMLELKNITRQTNPENFDKMRKALAHGQSGFTMVGDPDHIASELARIADVGYSGIGFSFLNYLRELPYFAQEVLPRLEKMGLREKRQRAHYA